MRNLKRALKPLMTSIRRPWYRGITYWCPLCSTGLRAFLPLPRLFRQSVELGEETYSYRDYETLSVDSYLCPVCRANDRSRLVAHYLIVGAERASRPWARFVHFAPDDPRMRELVRRLGFHEYRTSDLFMADVDDKMDITDLGYEDETVDAFICSHVLEHVPDDMKAMSELFRILRPGGWGVILVPIHLKIAKAAEDDGETTGDERLRRFGQAEHVRLYDKQTFLSRLTEAGFAVDQLTVNQLGEATLRRLGLAPSTTLYVARKR